MGATPSNFGRGFQRQNTTGQFAVLINIDRMYEPDRTDMGSVPRV